MIRSYGSESGLGTSTFFLEADRSTMAKQERPGSRRMNDKFWKYEHYIRAGRPFEKQAVTAIRIVTITLKGFRATASSGALGGH